MVSFGVEPEIVAANEDRRGPDTVNRLLLQGARHHHREAVFLCWEAERWAKVPDWRADRQAIRVGLGINHLFGISPGDLVALWLPLDQRWAVVERGLWALGAVSVPVWPEWPLEQVVEVLHDVRPKVLFAPNLHAVDGLCRVGGRAETIRAMVLLGGAGTESGVSVAFSELLDLGGALDTPERAGMWRNSARSVGPEATLSIEYSGDSGRVRATALRQGDLLQMMEAVQRPFPVRPGRVRLVASERPDRLSRAVVYAGWADGLTQTAFAGPHEERARLGELRPELVVGPGRTVAQLVGAFSVSSGPSRRDPPRRLLSRLGLGRDRGSGARTWVVVTDRSLDGSRGIEPGCEIRFVMAEEQWIDVPARDEV